MPVQNYHISFIIKWGFPCQNIVKNLDLSLVGRSRFLELFWKKNPVV